MEMHEEPLPVPVKVRVPRSALVFPTEKLYINDRVSVYPESKYPDLNMSNVTIKFL